MVPPIVVPKGGRREESDEEEGMREESDEEEGMREESDEEEGGKEEQSVRDRCNERCGSKIGK